jgi:hypothetical protein
MVNLDAAMQECFIWLIITFYSILDSLWFER